MPSPSGPGPEGSTRRRFASVAAAAAAGFLLTSCGPRRLRQMPPERLKQRLREMEREYSESGTPVTVGDAPPLPGVQFAYALDLDNRTTGEFLCIF